MMDYPDYRNLYKGCNQAEIARLRWAYILGLLSANCETVRAGIRPIVSINYVISKYNESLKTAMEREIRVRGCEVSWELINDGTKRAMWQGYIWAGEEGKRRVLEVIEFMKSWGANKKSVEYHQRLGKLYGYSEEAINRFCEEHKDS